MNEQDKKAIIRTLIERIRYQYPVGITTWGNCAKGCGSPARGSGVCKDCLVTELIDAGITPELANDYSVKLAARQAISAEIEGIEERMLR